MDQEFIQFIYFDLDDTLLDHRQAERNGLAELCRAFQRHFDHVEVTDVQRVYHEHSVSLWRQYAAGTLSKQDLQRLRFERTLQTLHVEGLDPEELNLYYLDCYARYWRFHEEARDAFHVLADRYPVGILTNGFAEVQQAKFEAFPELRERARVLLISEEVGYMKPHPRIFAHAADKAGVPPSSLLYVGDSYHSDVQGALGAGWRVAWYTSEAEVDSEAVFCFDEWEMLTSWLLERD